MEETTKSSMQVIWDNLNKKYPAGAVDREFPDAILSLFKEFAKTYETEWARLNDNARMYSGDHWDTGSTGKNGALISTQTLQPSTPIITSTIENIKADLSDEFPEAVFVPDGIVNENTILAKVLTKVIAEELDLCGWEAEYDKLVHDVLCDGWGVVEIGYDFSMNGGFGGSFIRQINNKNFLCDPQCPNMQDGRAVFKMERVPKDWVIQRYPKFAPFLSDDGELLDPQHDMYDSTTSPADRKYLRLIEAWFKVYDPEAKRYKVHFVKLAGGQILENSCAGGDDLEARPDGVYAHGDYPFVITRLLQRKGSALGIGITDLFKDANRFVDKMDEILLTNAYRAARPRLFVQSEMLEDPDEIQDYENEIIWTKASPNAVAEWQDTQPLPSHMLVYMQEKREMIKQESGANDQSRGQSGGGITAASAISALQEMSTKRSRMEARALHYSFKVAVRMLVEVLRQFEIAPRSVTIMVEGKLTVLPFDRRSLQKSLGSTDNRILPIESYISIKTARQTKYTKLTYNDTVMKMLEMTANQGVDPLDMFEALQIDGMEEVLEKARRSRSKNQAAMQQQMEQMQAENAQMSQRQQEYRQALAQSNSMVRQQYQEPQQ